MINKTLKWFSRIEIKNMDNTYFEVKVMFKYESRYLCPVKVDRPNPNYAALLQ